MLKIFTGALRTAQADGFAPIEIRTPMRGGFPRRVGSLVCMSAIDSTWPPVYLNPVPQPWVPFGSQRAAAAIQPGDPPLKRFTCFFTLACATLAVAALSDGTLRGSPMDPPQVGDMAPAFEAKDDQGKTWKSTDHFCMKIVVVYFYPADFTGGCTKQACSFRDDAKPLTDKGVEVVGVSGDSVATHAEFKKAHKLEFTLLADETGALADKFGVKFAKKEGTAKFDGRIFVRGGTASRHTIIVGTDGKVAATYDVQDAAGDSKKVLEIVSKVK